MKIMMLLIGQDFPPDIRVEKEARALLAAGHQIIVVCENRRDRPQQECWNGVQIIRLPRLPHWLRRINTATLFTTLHSPLWEWHIRNLIRAAGPDLLHVHDLPFVGPGLRLARAGSIPLVADLHENYPALLQIWHTSEYRNPLDRFILSPARFTRYEARVLPLCSQVIVVVEEAIERVKSLGVKEERIVLVGNTEDIDAVGSNSEHAVVLPPSDMTLLYVGGFGPHRGLEVAISAMPRILEQIPSALLVIVGDGPGRRALQQLAQRLKVTQAVRFEGQQPFARVHGYIQASDICLVPHLANAHTNATMPHKLFQYMVMNKAVIVSDAIPLARVVHETGAGLDFESGNSDAFFECVIKLQDPSLRARMGAKGQDAVISKYNWGVDGGRLVELYNSIKQNWQLAEMQ